MIQKKVCMLGAFAVGKTSLVSRFVHSIFSDKYLTTHRRQDRQEVRLAAPRRDGVDPVGHLRRGRVPEGAHVVPAGRRRHICWLPTAPGARRWTWPASLQRAAEQEIGKVPFVLALNKVDLADQWQVDRRRARAGGRAGLESRADQRQDGRGRRGGVSDPRARDGVAIMGEHGQRRAPGGRLRARDRHFRAGARRRLCLGGHAAGLDGGFQQESDASRFWAASSCRRGSSGRSRGRIV